MMTRARWRNGSDLTEQQVRETMDGLKALAGKKNDTITLPWPPSVNTYWRHVVEKYGTKVKVLISEEGRAYRRVVAKEVMAQRMLAYGDERLHVHIRAFPPDRRPRDLDNILKAVLDSLEHAGVYPSDSQIDVLTVWREPVEKPGRVVVSVMEAVAPRPETLPEGW